MGQNEDFTEDKDVIALATISTFLFIIGGILLLFAWGLRDAEAASTDWTDSFETRTLGDLNGQGLWTTTGSEFDIVSSPVQSGTKAIGNNTAFSVNAELNSSFDLMTGIGDTVEHSFYFYTPDFDHFTDVDYRTATGTTRFRIDYSSIGAGASGLILKGGPSLIQEEYIATGLSINTWYKVTVLININNETVQAKLDNGSYSNTVDTSNQWGTISNFRFRTTGQIYFDSLSLNGTFSGDPIFENTSTRIVTQNEPDNGELKPSTTVDFNFDYFYNDTTDPNITIAGIEVKDMTDGFDYIPKEKTILASGLNNFATTTILTEGHFHLWRPYLRNSASTQFIRGQWYSFDVVTPSAQTTGTTTNPIPGFFDRPIEGAGFNFENAEANATTSLYRIGDQLTGLPAIIVRKHPFAWFYDFYAIAVDQRQDSSTTTLVAEIKFNDVDWATSSPLGTMIGSSTAYNVKLFDSDLMTDLIPSNVLGGLRLLVSASLWLGLAFMMWDRIQKIV